MYRSECYHARVGKHYGRSSLLLENITTQPLKGGWGRHLWMCTADTEWAMVKQTIRALTPSIECVCEQVVEGPDRRGRHWNVLVR